MADDQQDEGRERDRKLEPDTEREPNTKRSKKPDNASKPPPAGPHADPSLTNDEATPGTGTLPPPDGEPDDGGSVSS